MANLDLNTSLKDTIKNSDLRNVSANLCEVGIDQFIEPGVLQQIPIISTILGVYKTVANIKDYLLLKKIYTFLFEIQSVTMDQRSKMIDQIENGNGDKMYGEKLLFIIDSCQNCDDTKYIAKLFTAYLKEEITLEDFQSGATIIRNTFIDDFRFFLNVNKEQLERTYVNDWPSDQMHRLSNVGLCILERDDSIVKDNDIYEKDGTYDPYIVDGNELFSQITDIGNVIRSVLME